MNYAINFKMDWLSRSLTLLHSIFMLFLLLNLGFVKKSSAREWSARFLDQVYEIKIFELKPVSTHENDHARDNFSNNFSPNARKNNKFNYRVHRFGSTNTFLFFEG